VAKLIRREEVGRGPLGVVYRAEDAAGRSLALRVLPPERLRVPAVLQAVGQELKAASLVSHPNVVKVLGLVEFEGQRCVVGELVAGKTFADALHLGHKIGFQQVHSLGRIMAQALGFLHGRGIAHGCVRPSNVMVSGGVLKLADLGLRALAQEYPRDPADSYDPPEGHVDAASDVYALAAVLYHVLTGVHPKSQPQGVGLPLPSSFVPGVPEAFDRLLVRALHPRPEKRCTRADEVLRDLKDMMKLG
jgi:eukaryotic-like serine/threonine-protein kinase